MKLCLNFRSVTLIRNIDKHVFYFTIWKRIEFEKFKNILDPCWKKREKIKTIILHVHVHVQPKCSLLYVLPETFNSHSRILDESEIQSIHLAPWQNILEWFPERASNTLALGQTKDFWSKILLAGASEGSACPKSRLLSPSICAPFRAIYFCSKTSLEKNLHTMQWRQGSGQNLLNLVSTKDLFSVAKYT